MIAQAVGTVPVVVLVETQVFTPTVASPGGGMEQGQLTADHLTQTPHFRDLSWFALSLPQDQRTTHDPIYSPVQMLLMFL